MPLKENIFSINQKRKSNSLVKMRRELNARIREGSSNSLVPQEQAKLPPASKSNNVTRGNSRSNSSSKPPSKLPTASNVSDQKAPGTKKRSF